MANPDRILDLAAQVRTEQKAQIDSDPQYQGWRENPAVALRRQQALERLESEVQRAVDLALAGGW